MEIIKTLSEIGTFDIRLQESEDKHLDIVFGGNGDIYWIFDNYEVADLKIDPMYDTFIISKEDYDIYMIFNELYMDLINARIYYPDRIPNYILKYFPKEQEDEIKRCIESNKRIKNDWRYKKLVNNGIITWYSDEEYESIAEIVRISKKEDFYLLEFIRQSKKDDMGFTRLPGWYSIRFRLSGSTYTPCDLVFWRHFNNLQEYNPNIGYKENENRKKLILTNN